MARARRAPAQQPPAAQAQTPPPSAPVSQVATAVATGELIGPVGGGAAGVATGALSAAVIANALAAILGAFDAFNTKRRPQLRAYLTQVVTEAYPERTPMEVRELVREELAREREFVRKQRERLDRDLPEALRIADPEQRQQRIQQILARERRYAQMREAAAAERAKATADYIGVKHDSPEGGYWKLSPLVSEHTPLCLAMGEQFWPHSVLKRIRPKLHAGCACDLVSLQDAVARGFMLPDQVPDEKEALRRAARITRGWSMLSESALPGEVDQLMQEVHTEPWLVGLAEARYELRYPRGDVRGGEFRPHDAAGVRRSVRRAFRELVPHMPRTPAERRHDSYGEWQTIAGKQVFVPEHRAFERKIDGRVYYSPPGTTEVHDQGAYVRNAPTIPPERGADVSDTMMKIRVEQRAGAAREAREALAYPHAQDRPPARVGSPPKATHGGMLDAGFVTESNSVSPHTGAVTFKYRHPGSDARAEITYADHRVTHVAWKPGVTPTQPKRLLTRAPKGWDEFTQEVVSITHDAAKRVGHQADISRVVHDPSLAGHSGEMDWDGTMRLGERIKPDVERLAERRANGEELLHSEKRGVYAAYRTAVHEAYHAAYSVRYRGQTERALEEALTEELAAVETARVLRRHGLTDVLTWAHQNPLDSKVQGSYGQWRGILRGILQDSNLPEDKYGDVLGALKWSGEPSQRAGMLAGLLSGAGGSPHGPSFEQALVDVHARFAGKTDDLQGIATPFVPLLHADTSDLPDFQPIAHAGGFVYPGAEVNVNLPDVNATGRVEQIVQGDDGEHFVAHVRFPDGTLWRNVDGTLLEPTRLSPDAPSLVVKDYEGEVGNRRHVTRTEEGVIPLAAIAGLGGDRGEVPGEHRNKQGATWEEFVRDVRENGVRDPIFITVDPDGEPKINEGNHRRDAAVVAGLSMVPVEIRYFGHAEQQGTVLDRAGLTEAAFEARLHPRDRVGRWTFHDTGAGLSHAAESLYGRLRGMSKEERAALADEHGGVMAPSQDATVAAREVVRGEKPAVLVLGGHKTRRRAMAAALNEMGIADVPEHLADVYARANARDHGLAYEADPEMEYAVLGKPDAVDLIERALHGGPYSAWRHVLTGVGLGYSEGDIARFFARPELEGKWSWRRKPFGGEVQEAEFEERLHPRGREGKWVRKLGATAGMAARRAAHDVHDAFRRKELDDGTGPGAVSALGQVLAARKEAAPKFEADLLGMLREARPRYGEGKIEVAPGSDEEMAKAAQRAARWFPAEWIDGAGPVQILGKGFGRGSDAYMRPEIAKSKLPTLFVAPGDREQSLVHEMAHWLEDRNPEVAKETHAFLERRTAGAPEQDLNDVDSTAHMRARVKDGGFVDAYMGRIYEHHSTEVLSMGMEALVGGAVRIEDDPDHLEWILRLLAGETPGPDVQTERTLRSADMIERDVPEKIVIDLDTGKALVTSEVLPNAETEAAYEHAFKVIDQVHAVRLLAPEPPPKVPLLMIDRGDDSDASYAKIEDDVRVPLLIALSPGSPRKESAVAHEWGHYLDEQVLGGRRDFGSHQALSDPEHPLRPLIETLLESPTLGKLHTLFQSDDEVPVSVNNGEVKFISIKDFHPYIEYLLGPHEVFARAYAQWIATRSNDSKMLAQLEPFWQPNQLIPMQWSPAEFEPIGGALDRMAEQLGWT